MAGTLKTLFRRVFPKSNRKHISVIEETQSINDIPLNKNEQDSNGSFIQRTISFKKKKKSVNKQESDRLLSKRDLLNIFGKRFNLNSMFSQKYCPVEFLGDGSFGFVMMCERVSDKKRCAVKFILKSKVSPTSWIVDDDDVVPFEVYLLKRLDHPNIVKFLDYFEDTKYIYLVTELHGTQWSLLNPKLNPHQNPGLRNHERMHHSCNNLLTFVPSDPQLQNEALILNKQAEKLNISSQTSFDLFECIDAHYRLPEFAVKKIFKQILSAVQYLNALQIVHRDLKDENIVVDENYDIKIIDFGSAAYLPFDEMFDQFNGTMQFASPEILLENQFNGTCAEVWTLGVLLYTMLFNENPFYDQSHIIAAKLDPPLKVSESPTSPMHLVRQLLEPNWKKRIGLFDIQNHQWLQ